jgi:hypothetical protein
MVYGAPSNSLEYWRNEGIFLAVYTTFWRYFSQLDVVYFVVEVLLYGFDLGDVYYIFLCMMVILRSFFF